MEKNIDSLVFCTYCGRDITYVAFHDCGERERSLNKVIEGIDKMKKDKISNHSSLPGGDLYMDDPEDLTESQKAIIACMDSMRDFLLEKNRRYGDSALHPKRMFSKATTDEQILVRLDDKISRIQNSTELRKNDIADMIGYLALLCVAKRWTDFSDLLD